MAERLTIEMDLVDRVCAWCSKILGQKESAKAGDTHTICVDCLLKFDATKEDRRGQVTQ